MAPNELKELKTQLQELIEKGFIHPSCRYGELQYYLSRKGWIVEIMYQLSQVESSDNKE